MLKLKLNQHVILKDKKQECIVWSINNAKPNEVVLFNLATQEYQKKDLTEGIDGKNIELKK